MVWGGARGGEAFADGAGGDGLLHVFVPHATAGVALMETGSGSEEDLEETVGRLLHGRAQHVDLVSRHWQGARALAGEIPAAVEEFTRALAIRPDRGQWLITMDLPTWLDLLKEYKFFHDSPIRIEVKRYARSSLHSTWRQKFGGP